MNLLDVELVVVVVKHHGAFRWFRSDREHRVLDLKKWNQEFVDAGHETPAVDSSNRFNIDVLNEETMDMLSELNKRGQKIADQQ